MMEELTLDPEHEDRALAIIREAERLLGERRFGGGWIDRTAPSGPRSTDPQTRSGNGPVAIFSASPCRK